MSEMNEKDECMNEDEAQCEVLRVLRKRCCTKLSLKIMLSHAV